MCGRMSKFEHLFQKNGRMYAVWDEKCSFLLKFIRCKMKGKT